MLLVVRRLVASPGLFSRRTAFHFTGVIDTGSVCGWCRLLLLAARRRSSARARRSSSPLLRRTRSSCRRRHHAIPIPNKHVAVRTGTASHRHRSGSRAVASAVGAKMEKVTFGDGLPGYEAGDKAAPAVIVLQEWCAHVPLPLSGPTLCSAHACLRFALALPLHSFNPCTHTTNTTHNTHTTHTRIRKGGASPTSSRTRR